MKDKLREMYENGLRGIEPSISANGLLKAVANGWITTEDAVEILGSDNALETVRAAKLLEISKACNAVIVAGVDVPIGDRRDHFNLKLEDQSNINNLFRVVELGGTEYPYQADDGTCTVYSATEIAQIYVAAQTLITGQTAYHNALKSYVNAMTDAKEIAAVQYGMDLLGDFHKGEGRIILALQWNGRPWGCGSGSKGSWNNTKVQWEICEPAGHTYAGGTMVGYDVAKNQGYFDRMWKMVVAWNVYMVKKFGYPISGISDHAESYRAGYGSNHGDVGQWWPKHGKSMDALRKEVQEILNGETEDDDMDVTRFKELWGEMRKELQDNDASAYSAEAREWATKNGLIAGNGTTVSGEPNCMWGDILTREQFVTVLYRWTQMMGKA